MLTFLDEEPDSVTQEEYARRINQDLESEGVDQRVDFTQITMDVINRYVEAIGKLDFDSADAPDEPMAIDRATAEYKSSLLSLVG